MINTTAVLAKAAIDDMGRFIPPGQYIVMAPPGEILEDADLKSVLCFGKAGQIRTLGGLVHSAILSPFIHGGNKWFPVDILAPGPHRHGPTHGGWVRVALRGEEARAHMSGQK